MVCCVGTGCGYYCVSRCSEWWSSFLFLLPTHLPPPFPHRSPRKGLMSPRNKVMPTKQVFGFDVDSLTHTIGTTSAVAVGGGHPLASSHLSQFPMQLSNGQSSDGQSHSSTSSGVSDEGSTDIGTAANSQEDNSDRRCRKGSPHSVSPPIDTKSFHTDRKISPPTNRPGHLRFT